MIKIIKLYLFAVLLFGVLISYPVYYVAKSNFFRIENYHFAYGIRIKVGEVKIGDSELKKHGRALDSTVFVYEVFDRTGNHIQNLYGSTAWNIIIPYDIDGDNNEELFLNQWAPPEPLKKGWDKPCYKFNLVNGKFEFYKNYPREELPLDLDFQLYPIAWIQELYLHVIIVYGLNLLNLIAVSIYFLIKRFRTK
ncbi:hypothetical protein EHQ52_15460 [Leptospira koniambonensis]|uniref:Uncharacterized protein n=1 Tax=Leptospira koniambonensis TaxID=2484950 RepID=A0A4R9J2W9_9LEPT|nr:hypothetical protein [Leptospira koniambonensis]TGL31333.1 hypothetical protein EHQ52_15460 [Leptospira koniambonensis]